MVGTDTIGVLGARLRTRVCCAQYVTMKFRRCGADGILGLAPGAPIWEDLGRQGIGRVLSLWIGGPRGHLTVEEKGARDGDEASLATEI